MVTVAITGGGFAGLTTALLLAADGHDVTVVERDPAPPTRHPRDAWSAWERRAVPQFRQTHAYLARARNLLRGELPHVWTRLLEAGIVEHNLAAHPPSAIHDVARRDGDDELVYVCGRRPIVESVLRHAAEDDPRIEVLNGVVTKGLLTRDSPAGSVVTGVATDAGAIAADVVIDCGGRRSKMPEWLEDAGADRPEERSAEYRIAYWTQWFRLRSGAEFPELSGPPAMEIGPIEVLRIPADDGWFSITVVAPAEDTRFRVLSDQNRLLRFLSRLDLTSDWVDERLAEPVGGILPMFTIVDQRRRFPTGERGVRGVLGVGDAIAASNPSLARGTSFALMHGVWLRDLLRDSDAAATVSERFEEKLVAEFDHWWESTIATDQAHLDRMRAAASGRDVEPDPAWIFQHAAMHDADLWRAALRVRLVLDLPSTVIAAPGLLDRVGAIVDRVGPPRIVALDVEGLLESPTERTYR